MKLREGRKTFRVGSLLRGESGFLLIAALVFLAILSLVGTTAYLLSSTDIKIGGNYRNTRKALQVALAGTEQGREVLRQVNAGNGSPVTTDPTSFNAELVYYAAGNQPLISSGTLDGYSYTVTMSNDADDPGGNTADSNNKVLLTSTATGNNDVKATVEIAISLPPPPAAPPPVGIPNPVAAIALLGDSGSFIGGNSNAKSLNGDDQCGNVSSLPVVAVSAAGSLSGVQSSISGSQPTTYHTKVNGVSVNASNNMNAIAQALTPAQMVNNGITLNDATSLNNMVQTIHDLGQTTVVPGGSDNSNVNLGDVNNLKIVVVDGDFTMNGNASGAGLLVVKGQLTFAGNINYTGIIMVIGTGTMVRNGGGNGTISGAVWVASTAGSDGIVGNADDAMGPAILNTSGGGASNVGYCSSAVNNAIDATAPPPTYSPLIVKSFREIL